MVKWVDVKKTVPQTDDDYLCLVEYDFDGRHYKTKRILSYCNGRWTGMGRDSDVITYWSEFPKEPNDLRCTECLWPVQWCHCGGR